MTKATVYFATPRRLPKPDRLAGRVVVLDLAFAGIGRSFAKTTGRFIEALGARLAVWVDHHDHKMHEVFAADARFVLSDKAQHPGCAELVTEDLVREIGPVETILVHNDLDGLYCAAKWLGGGREPYAGADADARAVDSRIGDVGPTALMVDRALRARPKDEALRHRILAFLADGRSQDRGVVQEAAAEFDRLEERARQLAKEYDVSPPVAYIEVDEGDRSFDKTTLLMEGQKRTEVSVVKQGPYVTVAAAFDSGWNFLDLLGLDGGMPTRVSVTEARLDELMRKLHEGRSRSRRDRGSSGDQGAEHDRDSTAGGRT